MEIFIILNLCFQVLGEHVGHSGTIIVIVSYIMLALQHHIYVACLYIRWGMLVSIMQVVYESRVGNTNGWEYKLNMKGIAKSGYHDLCVSRNPDVWSVDLEKSPSLYASYMTRWTQNLSTSRFCIWTFKLPVHNLKVATANAHVLCHVNVNIWIFGITHKRVSFYPM